MSLSKFFQSRNSSTSSTFSNLFQPTQPKLQVPKSIKKPQTIIQEQPKIQKKPSQKQLPQNLQSTIFIGNIPLDSTHKEIKNYFKTYGKVQKVWFRSIPTQQSKIPKKACHILKKYQEGADSMNAYVKFSTIDQARNACSANGQKINQHNIRVTMCQQFEIDYEKTIFIGNLPHNVKDQQIWDAFKQVGKIESVRIIRKKFSMQGIGIGYVKFSCKQQMKKAIKQMNGKQIGERPMRIKKAVEKQRLKKKFKNIEKKKIKTGRMMKANQQNKNTNNYNNKFNNNFNKNKTGRMMKANQQNKFTKKFSNNFSKNKTNNNIKQNKFENKKNWKTKTIKKQRK